MEGLSALSLDALTSVAYGPEAMLIVLAGAGVTALHLILPITIAIVGLLVDVGGLVPPSDRRLPSRRRGVRGFRDNFGPRVSKLAGASLIVDYTLTVAVSIAAGVGQLTSAFPSIRSYTVPMCLGILLVITALNLRGLGDGARAFLLPTLDVHRRVARHHRRRSDPSARPRHPTDRIVAGDDPRGGGGLRASGVEGVLGRVQRAHRRGSHRQRCPAVQGTEGGASQANRASARHHPGGDAAGPGGAHQQVPRTTAYEPDGAEPDHGGRGWAPLGLLHSLAHHHRGPGAGRQHLLRRSADTRQPPLSGTTICRTFSA